MADYDEVPAADVPEDAVLLDVREDDEWDAGHAPGALHIPLGALASRAGELPSDADTVFVVCRSGGRSGRAAAWLTDNGVSAVNVIGGMGDWAAAGRPMVTDDGSPARVA